MEAGHGPSARHEKRRLATEGDFWLGGALRGISRHSGSVFMNIGLEMQGNHYGYIGFNEAKSL